VGTTAWQVDATLLNNAQYWWRSRAHDGVTNGPWMPAATFYVNETNAAPYTVSIAGPPNGAVLRNSTYALSWYATSDPDAGDTILDYHIQIDDDPVFGTPAVDDAAIVLSGGPTGSGWLASRRLADLAGSVGMTNVATYHWRIRARDSRFRYSDWSAGPRYFTYPLPPPGITSCLRGTNGCLVLRWDQPADSVWVLFSPTLTADVWQVHAGPLLGNSWTLAPASNAPAGFFRLKVEE
jgi:hypothetical protein